MTNSDPAELQKFAQLAEQWWDPNGDMGPLHTINPLRLGYIAERAELKNQTVVDVGCGGGILSEALAQSGAQVTGIDLATESLAVASDHAKANGLTIDYREISAEDLAAEKPAHYDVVTCLEMLEHVPDPAAVVAACATLVKPGGQVFLSTINRNPKAYAFAVLGAEYILGLLPRGTHDYSKFIKPSELTRYCRAADLHVNDLAGMHYNPLLKHYSLGPGVDVNYLLHATRAV